MASPVVARIHAANRLIQLTEGSRRETMSTSQSAAVIALLQRIRLDHAGLVAMLETASSSFLQDDVTAIQQEVTKMASDESANFSASQNPGQRQQDFRTMPAFLIASVLISMREHTSEFFAHLQLLGLGLHIGEQTKHTMACLLLAVAKGMEEAIGTRVYVSGGCSRHYGMAMERLTTRGQAWFDTMFDIDDLLDVAMSSASTLLPDVASSVGLPVSTGNLIRADVPIPVPESRADTRPRMREDQCRGTCRICRLRQCNLPGAHGMDDLANLSRQCRCELCEGPTLPDSDDDKINGLAESLEFY